MGRKEIRQKQLIQIILDHGGIPATGLLAAELGVTERTIQNDLNDIKKLVPAAAVEDIERMLMIRLRERLPEMTDVSLLKLAEFFLSKKSEARVETRGTMTVAVDRGAEIEELLQSYDQVLTETSPEEGAIQKDDPGESVHPPQADG